MEQTLEKRDIIAVDFDGTLCENQWPEIGLPNTKLIKELIYRRKQGDKLILWTNRVDDKLENAVNWCKEQGLEFDAINDNLPEIVESFGSNSRKVFANIYIDDRANNRYDLPFAAEREGMMGWAEREVDIACKREREDSGSEEGAWDYGVACYESALKAFIDSVQEALENGDKVQLIGFGTFETRERAAREGRNPRTKETITIPASTVPVFKAGKEFKDRVK